MEKDKALDAALSQIERAFGKGSIMRLGQNTNIDIEMGFADKDIVREEEHIAELTRKQERSVFLQQ